MIESVAAELVRFAGLPAAYWRADRVVLLCPFHEDRRPSAAVLASGVLTCSTCARSWSPYEWLVALGATPADVMELLERVGLRDGDRPSRRRAGGSRPPTGSRAPEVAPLPRAAPAAPEEPRELPADLLDRLAAAEISRRRYDARLGELRGLAADVLGRAGVGIGRPVDFGFSGPRAAIDELRLLIPVRSVAGRTVGVLAVAPNPERRADPKVLALAGTTRLPLVLADVVADPIAPVLIVAEGELDALAVSSAGLRAIGLPGLGGYARHAPRIADVVREHGLDRGALLIPDADAPGRRTFRELADALAALGIPVTFADVLDDRDDDVGRFLVAAAADLAVERPDLSLDAIRREAGRRLLALAEGRPVSATKRCGGSPSCARRGAWRGGGLK